MPPGKGTGQILHAHIAILNFGALWPACPGGRGIEQSRQNAHTNILNPYRFLDWIARLSQDGFPSDEK